MKLLISYDSKGKFFHMKEFANSLEKFDVQCELVEDTCYSRGFPNKNPKDGFFGNKKFKKLINDFKPDAVFFDRQSHFGSNTLKAKIHLFVLLKV